MNVVSSTHLSPTHGVGRHALSPAALHRTSQLMDFNWCPASYAHRDWLGPWAELLEPRGRVGMGLLRRASMVLLERHGLRDRYLRSVDDHLWLLLPTESLLPIADELGVAMLGGWVRCGLEREQVAQQLRVLCPQRRERALNHAATLRALPYPGSENTGSEHAGCAQGWPLSLLGPSSVFELGVSCMAELLSDDPTGGRGTGAKERFMLRFAPGLIVPLQLSSTQRVEAAALIGQLMQHPVQETQP